MIEVPVNIPGATYSVYIGSGILSHIGSLVAKHCQASTYVIISDTTVSSHYMSMVSAQMKSAGKVHVCDFPAGESSKTRTTWSDLTDRMIQAGVGRDAAILALGGGVVGDLAGFVAATYHRGVPYVQIPTSLLAMLDSSVGGKTGVDTPLGKNLVGSFHQPQLVVADTATLATLPDRHLKAGLAEALKHGVIADPHYFNWIEAESPAIQRGEPPILERLVRRSVEIKAEVVISDEKERGRRAILNFGHSVGHGIEAVSNYTMLHGEAIAIGMVVESQIGETLGITASGTTQRLSAVLEGFGLPVSIPAGYDPDLIEKAMRQDKKNRSGLMRFSVAKTIGECARTKPDLWTFELPETLLRTTLTQNCIS